MEHNLSENLCGEVSIAHADGSTECLDERCTLPHALHGCHADCSAIIPPCPCQSTCGLADQPQPALATAA
jgi:hypothetical protein